MKVDMVGIVESDLPFRIREAHSIAFARKLQDGGYILQIVSQSQTYELQRQRGGPRVFKTLEPLVGLLTKLGVAEFAILLDDATVQSPATAPWTRAPHSSRPSFRLDKSPF